MSSVLERAWVQRNRDGLASTDDFIALASQVSGQNLTRFLRDWVYSTKTPPMPGHQAWTVEPVDQAASRVQAQTALPAPLRR